MFRSLSALTLTATLTVAGLAHAAPNPANPTRGGNALAGVKTTPIVNRTGPSTAATSKVVSNASSTKLSPAATKLPDAAKVKIPPIDAAKAGKVSDATKIPGGGKLPDLKKFPDSAKLPDIKKLPDTKKVPDFKKLPDVGKLPDGKKIPDTKKVPDPKKLPDVGKLPDGKKLPDTKAPGGGKGPKDKSPEEPKTGKGGKHPWPLPNPFPTYHRDFGRVFAHGYYYPGRVHRHWSYCIWDIRYGCYCYWDPCCSRYYYWCQPDACYYPVSYCPYQTYCWTQPVCETCALPAPVDTNVRVIPCQTCAPTAVATTSLPTQTPEPTTEAFDAIPAVPQPVFARSEDGSR